MAVLLIMLQMPILTPMNTFQKTAITTLIAILILIAVGSLVRVSGAGLGCPDWPRCWGCWFPPSSADEIDKDYLAERGLNIQDFNPTKMWIEYINRLIGMLIGFLVIMTFVRSVPYRQTQPPIFFGSLFATFLVGFEGWLGGQVVKSGLRPGMITFHMVGAMALLCLLLYITFKAVDIRTPTTLPNPRLLMHLSALLFFIICIQILLGTQVREAIDPYIKNDGGISRSAWLANIGLIDHIHRSFTWLVIAVAVYLVYTLRKHEIKGLLHITSQLSLILILAQAIFGIALAYGGLPHVFQVLHLFTASLLICSVYLLWLTLKTINSEV